MNASIKATHFITYAAAPYDSKQIVTSDAGSSAAVQNVDGNRCYPLFDQQKFSIALEDVMYWN
ncbi:hypothetical protein [Stenotrophomonas sp. PS02298]|uniref:hypothetical protein n=1 Tax=Stenotrophomonas sp. PS02298 TaxID=2991424 RepID=UPI00249CD721|nr:hypothetical protein [Stenotrophomonas sp. PS02298]